MQMLTNQNLSMELNDQA